MLFSLLQRSTTRGLLFALCLSAKGFGDELPLPQNPVLVNEVLRLSALGQANVKNAKSASIRYRAAGANDNLKAFLTPLKCKEALLQIDFENDEAPLRRFVEAVSDDQQTIATQPWTEITIESSGRRLRTTRKWNDETDIHVTDEDLSIRWDHANYQLHIEPVAQNNYYQPRPLDFLQSLRVPNRDLLKSAEIVDLGEQIRLAAGNAESRVEMLIEKSNGMLSRQTRFQKDKGLVSDRFWLNWSKGPSGVSFPGVTAEFEYLENILARYEVTVTTEFEFNSKITNDTFKVAAPVGSYIFSDVDGLSGGTVNRPLADVTSQKQIKAATAPFSKTLTSEEMAGVAAVRERYALAESQILKRIGPPYPSERKFLPRMLGDRYAQQPGEYNRLLSFDGKGFDREFAHIGHPFTISALIQRILKLRNFEFEGNQKLLETPLPGDFVYSNSASPDDLISGLEKLLQKEVDPAIRFEFRQEERPVFVATGKMKIELPPRQRRVGMNAGLHTGDYGESISRGSLEKFLNSLSAYIKIQVDDQTEKSKERFEWSERWYDTKRTKPEDRFEFHPEHVIEIVAAQTGINFRREVRITRVLFVERD